MKKSKVNKFFINDKKFKDIKIGDKSKYERLITASLIHNFAKLIKDYNPAHYNKKNAKVIANGMLIGSLVSTLLGNYFQVKNNLLVSYSLNFKKPISQNQKIKIISTIVQKINFKKILIVKIEIYRNKNILIASGETIIKVR